MTARQSGPKSPPAMKAESSLRSDSREDDGGMARFGNVLRLSRYGACELWKWTFGGAVSLSAASGGQAAPG